MEGATLFDLRAEFLTVHAFVGMLLIPVVALKLASTGWRMARYYLRGEEYVRRGPPHLFLRALVAPLTVVSTIFLFGTGVLLLVFGEAHGTLAGLREANSSSLATAVRILRRLPRWSARCRPAGRDGAASRPGRSCGRRRARSRDADLARGRSPPG